jgi:hypothetical protein
MLTQWLVSVSTVGTDVWMNLASILVTYVTVYIFWVVNLPAVGCALTFIGNMVR